MAYPKRLLNDDEELILDLHPHWWYFVGRLIALIGSLLLGMGVLIWQPEGALGGVLLIAVAVLVVVCLVWFAESYARWATTHFVLTDQRIIHRSGVVRKHSTEISLENINTVFTSENLRERMLGHGDLLIESAGEKGQQKFNDVPKPTQVKKEIYSQKEVKEARRLRRIAGVSETAKDDSDSVSAQIRELDALRKDGLLSEEEFIAKKQELLDRM